MRTIQHGQKHYSCLHIDHASFILLLGLIERLQQEGESGLEVLKGLWLVHGLSLKFAEPVDNLFTTVKKRNEVGEQAYAENSASSPSMAARVSEPWNGCTLIIEALLCMVRQAVISSIAQGSTTKPQQVLVTACFSILIGAIEMNGLR